MAENALTPCKFDLGVALEDPSHSEEWMDVLRMIARHSVMRDETACRLRRVSKAFQFCWSLADVTVRVDRRFAPKTTDVLLAIETFRKRERLQRLWVYDGFQVTTLYRENPPQQGTVVVKEVHFDAGTGFSNGFG
jgi:hypothetical protein